MRKKKLENKTYQELFDEGYSIFPPYIKFKTEEGALEFGYDERQAARRDDAGNTTKSPNSGTKAVQTSTGKTPCDRKDTHPLADFEISDPEPGPKNPRVVRLGKFTSENSRVKLAVEEVVIKAFALNFTEGQRNCISANAYEFVKRMPDHPNRTMILGILEAGKEQVKC